MTASARHQSLGVHLCTITDHLPPGIRKALSHRSRKVLVARLALTPPFRAAFAHHEGLCSPGAAGLMGKPRRSAARASRLDGSNFCKKEGELFAASTSHLDGRRIPVEADETFPLLFLLLDVHCPSASHRGTMRPTSPSSLFKFLVQKFNLKPEPEFLPSKASFKLFESSVSLSSSE